MRGCATVTYNRLANYRYIEDGGVVAVALDTVDRMKRLII